MKKALTGACLVLIAAGFTGGCGAIPDFVVNTAKTAARDAVEQAVSQAVGQAVGQVVEQATDGLTDLDASLLPPFDSE